MRLDAKCVSSIKTANINNSSNSCLPSLKMFYQNVTDLDCIHTKLSSLQDLAYSNNFDVLAVVETWISKKISDCETLSVGYRITELEKRRWCSSGSKGQH